VTAVDPQPLALADSVARNRETLSAEIDGEVVALDIARGACFGLDPVGARIWAMIETPQAIERVCEALVAIYDVEPATCQADVLDLMTALRSEGLIEVSASPPLSPKLAPKTP